MEIRATQLVVTPVCWLVKRLSVAASWSSMGPPNGPNADSMGFTSTLDIAGTHGATGVTFEAWYTDTNSGAWAKLFSFGNGTGGSNIIFNLQQGGSGQGRIQYQGMPESNFGPRPDLGVEHHLALSIFI